MLDCSHDLTVMRQTEPLGLSRGAAYSLPRPISAADLPLMLKIDKLRLEHSIMGARMLRDQLARKGITLGGVESERSCSAWS